MKVWLHRRLNLLWILALELPLVACSPPPKASSPAVDAGTPDPDPSTRAVTFETIEGAWRIVLVNGKPAVGVQQDSGGERTPSVTFLSKGYGGTTGCNYFGGLGLLDEGRYYPAPGPQTQMGCGELTAQENAITGVLWEAPQIIGGRDGSLTLVGDRHRVVLRRDRSLLAPSSTGEDSMQSLELADTSWSIHAIDGQWLDRVGQPDNRILRFQGHDWSGIAACATIASRWRQEHDRILSERPTSTEQSCSPAEAAIDRKLAGLMTANPRFVSGPNGEILIVGGGHWVVGMKTRSK